MDFRHLFPSIVPMMAVIPEEKDQRNVKGRLSISKR
jgi:hypothetical protein